MISNDDWPWRTITRNGTDVRVRRPSGPSAQAQAYIEHSETFVFMMSETLTGDELATLAAGLKPAPHQKNLAAAGRGPTRPERAKQEFCFVAQAATGLCLLLWLVPGGKEEWQLAARSDRRYAGVAACRRAWL